MRGGTVSLVCHGAIGCGAGGAEGRRERIGDPPSGVDRASAETPQPVRKHENNDSRQDEGADVVIVRDVGDDKVCDHYTGPGDQKHHECGPTRRPSQPEDNAEYEQKQRENRREHIT